MKINPIAVFTSLAVVAAGTFGYVATRPPAITEPAKLVAEAPKAEAPKVEVPKVEAPKVEAEAPKPEAKPEQQASAVTPAKPAAVPEPATPIVPSFDTVRVETGGETVIAGRATPGTEVSAKLNGDVVATTIASADGSFVMIPEKPLPAGAGTLTLETKLNGAAQTFVQTVAVSVKPKEPGQTTVAVLTPDAPTKITQAPEKAPDSVTLDAVDYSASGNIMFAGRGQPGSALRLYVDNILLGEAKSDDQGKWNYSGGTTIAPGVYTLRVDQLAVDGKVTSRVESPFKREAAEKAAEAAQPVTPPVTAQTETPKPATPQPSRITIQPGDNLWVLSRNLYGFGRQYTVIYEANKALIKNPSLIYPGQILTAPTAQAKTQ